MAKVISSLTNAIAAINTVLNSNETPPTSSEEDFTVWMNLCNMAINLWENEDGLMWRELFGKLTDATDGDKTTTTAHSYTVPTNFRFPASGYVWLGSGTNKTAYKVIRQEEIQLYENNANGNWCFFLLDTTPTLEFNPNLTMTAGQTITYNYYKYATALAAGSDTFEMADPMFAVYYALAELTKEEGNQLYLSILEQKLESMKGRNVIMPEFAENTITDPTSAGFGV